MSFKRMAQRALAGLVRSKTGARGRSVRRRRVRRGSTATRLLRRIARRI